MACPQWVQNEFWAEEVDPILLAGLERANRFRKEAIAKALKEYPVLQIGAVSKRIRSLRIQQNGRPKAASFAGGGLRAVAECCPGGRFRGGGHL